MTLTAVENSLLLTALEHSKVNFCGKRRFLQGGPEEKFGQLFTHLRQELACATRTTDRLTTLFRGELVGARRREPDIWPTVERMMRRFIMDQESEKDPELEARGAIQVLDHLRYQMTELLKQVDPVIDKLAETLTILEGEAT